MLKLINAGLGRTGTTSLKVALERLGYGPCYHMFDIVGSEERLGQWEEIVCDGRIPDWKAVFDGYTSAVDGLCVLYYRQLMEAFPEAKMILTVRDAERWYQSTYDTLYQFVLKSEENPPPAGSRQSRMYHLMNTIVWSGLFDGRFSDKEYAIGVYRERNQQIIRDVGADRLLVYDVKQGWEPLCAYLGVDVPPEEFPHANDTASMRDFIHQDFGVAGPAAGAVGRVVG